MQVIVNAEAVDQKDEEECEYSEWEIEDAYRTLKKAEEIKNDPALMKLVAEEYNEDVKAINSLSDLKKLANTVSAKEAADMED